MPNNPTILGNYLIEIDGVSVCEAQEVEMGEKKNDPYEIYKGTSDLPIIGRGKSKVEEITIKQAYGLNNEGPEFARAFDDYVRGVNLTKPTVRIVTLGEDGQTVVATDEYPECVFTSFKPTGKKGDSKDAAMFEIKFRPTDHIAYY